jgi:hypothetical protein
VYCVIVFIAVTYAKSNSPTCNCNDTVVNWLIKEQFCNLHVRFMFIRAINTLQYKKYTVPSHDKLVSLLELRYEQVWEPEGTAIWMYVQWGLVLRRCYVLEYLVVNRTVVTRVQFK